MTPRPPRRGQGLAARGRLTRLTQNHETVRPVIYLRHHKKRATSTSGYPQQAQQAQQTCPKPHRAGRRSAANSGWRGQVNGLARTSVRKPTRCGYSVAVLKLSFPWSAGIADDKMRESLQLCCCPVPLLAPFSVLPALLLSLRATRVRTDFACRLPAGRRACCCCSGGRPCASAGAAGSASRR